MTNSRDSLNNRVSPPLVSIIIPVWNVESYLSACLDSITQQSFRDLEIIAVEGASTDSSGAILDEWAIQEPRLTVVHLDPPPGHSRVGPGRARNAGLACAKGDYIWFVDGDDAVEDGCLETIASRISRAGPDVLLVGNVRVSADGRRTWPGHDQHLLQPEGARFTLAERPSLAGVGLEPWNKIVRREFLLTTEALFLEQWPHEDIPVSCEVLLAAASIAVLSAPCYRYRQDRRGSAMAASNSARHFNVFNAWQGVLSAARARCDTSDPAVTPDIYAVLFERSIWHLTNIYDKGSLRFRGAAARRYVRSSSSRRKFFSQMHAHYAKYKPLGYLRPAAFRGMKFFLIEKDAYLSYRLLTPMNDVRNMVNRSRHSGAPAAAGPA